MEFDTFVDLLGDALVGRAVGGGEGFVVAEATPSKRDFAIAIGASESSVDGYLLGACAHQMFEIGGVGVEPASGEKCGERLFVNNL